MIGLRGAQQLRRWLGVVVMLLPVGWTRAGISLEFERKQYGAGASDGRDVEVRVMIDGDLENPGRQPVPQGIFGYGFLVRFDEAHWQPAPSNAVLIEPALDYFGFSSGAGISMGQGFVAIKGNINPLGSPWTGNLLATLRLRFTGPLPPSTPLGLEIFQQAPNDAAFVDGLGRDIDTQVVPRSSILVRLDPPRVEWVAGVQPHARLTFNVPQGAEVALQWSRSLAQGQWQNLPGAPHTSGEYLDFTPADRRFYRLSLLDR